MGASRVGARAFEERRPGRVRRPLRSGVEGAFEAEEAEAEADAEEAETEAEEADAEVPATRVASALRPAPPADAQPRAGLRPSLGVANQVTPPLIRSLWKPGHRCSLIFRPPGVEAENERTRTAAPSNHAHLPGHDEALRARAGSEDRARRAQRPGGESQREHLPRGERRAPAPEPAHAKTVLRTRARVRM